MWDSAKRKGALQAAEHLQQQRENGSPAQANPLPLCLGRQSLMGLLAPSLPNGPSRQSGIREIMLRRSRFDASSQLLSI
ncbi:MAG: hypothetical protein EBX54_12895 [Betaproteobacteria bacterium]|nr:hypothetical protein [Betaproteobacteria bacterium]